MSDHMLLTAYTLGMAAVYSLIIADHLYIPSSSCSPIL